MPVQDWMSKDLVTIDEETSIMKASRVMKQNDIQHLPVLKKGRLVGIVSDRDLKEATPSKATTLDIHEMYHLLDTITVKSLMPKKLYTIAPGDTVERAAAVMLKHHISALPVVDAQGALSGILTKGDVFRAFVSISGISQGPLAMGLELPDQPGYIKQVTDVIREHGGRIASIMTRAMKEPRRASRASISGPKRSRMNQPSGKNWRASTRYFIISLKKPINK